VLLQLRDDQLTKAVFVTPTFDKRKTKKRQTNIVRKRAFGLRTFRLSSVWVVPTTDGAAGLEVDVAGPVAAVDVESAAEAGDGW